MKTVNFGKRSSSNYTPAGITNIGGVSLSHAVNHKEVRIQGLAIKDGSEYMSGSMIGIPDDPAILEEVIEYLLKIKNQQSVRHVV